MYNVCLIGHKQAVLVSIQCKLIHIWARMTSPYLRTWKFLLSLGRMLHTQRNVTPNWGSPNCASLTTCYVTYLSSLFTEFLGPAQDLLHQNCVFWTGALQYLRILVYSSGLSQVLWEVKNLPANAGDIRQWLQPLGREDPLEGTWQPTPVFLPGKAHGQRSLVGCSPWGRKEWDVTEWLGMHACAFWHLSTSAILKVRFQQSGRWSEKSGMETLSWCQQLEPPFCTTYCLLAGPRQPEDPAQPPEH